MKIVDFEQGSEVWKEWRKFGIGASDIPILMGTLPEKYKTKYQLWQIKCGHTEENAPNKAMYHGMQYEPYARKWLSEHLNIDLRPVCIQDEEIEYFRASLDAYDDHGHSIIEIKCPINVQTLDDAKDHGKVHMYWIDQVLWQMGLAGTEEAYIAIWDYRTHECIVIPVHWDKSRYEKMREEADAFWQHVKYGTSPEISSKDYKRVHNSDLDHLMYEYAIADKKEKAAKQQKQRLKTRILDYGDGTNFECDGGKVTQREGSTTYDIQAMRDDGIDVDKYVKKGSTSWTIRVTNNTVVEFEETI